MGRFGAPGRGLWGGEGGRQRDPPQFHGGEEKAARGGGRPGAAGRKGLNGSVQRGRGLEKGRGLEAKGNGVEVGGA